jgi:hypothetical protein
MGTLPTSPLVTPRSKEKSMGYASPGIRGLPRGVAHRSSKGTNSVRSHANTMSCVRDQSYGADANTCQHHQIKTSFHSEGYSLPNVYIQLLYTLTTW